jgi:hypothetical protein
LFVSCPSIACNLLSPTADKFVASEVCGKSCILWPNARRRGTTKGASSAANSHRASTRRSATKVEDRPRRVHHTRPAHAGASGLEARQVWVLFSLVRRAPGCPGRTACVYLTTRANAGASGSTRTNKLPTRFILVSTQPLNSRADVPSRNQVCRTSWVSAARAQVRQRQSIKRKAGSRRLPRSGAHSQLNLSGALVSCKPEFGSSVLIAKRNTRRLRFTPRPIHGRSIAIRRC